MAVSALDTVFVRVGGLETGGELWKLKVLVSLSWDMIEGARLPTSREPMDSIVGIRRM